MHGFQLWANLPASLKMTPPRYQDVPRRGHPRGHRRRRHPGPRHLRQLSGARSGPVDGIAADPSYLDVWVPPGSARACRSRPARHAFAYVFAGSGQFRNASDPLAVPTEGTGWADTSPARRRDNRSLVLFDRGDEVTVQAGEQGIRFLLVSGKPLREPVAWYGPIVMNTEDESSQAFDDFATAPSCERGEVRRGSAPAQPGSRSLILVISSGLHLRSWITRESARSCGGTICWASVRLGTSTTSQPQWTPSSQPNSACDTRWEPNVMKASSALTHPS